MARLIDADALKTAFPCGEYVRTESVRATIDSMPTIDAVPVVRCKDCIYFHDYGDGVKNCWGDGGIFTKDDDFCSHAERKDG